jgi:hypothetical protein
MWHNAHPGIDVVPQIFYSANFYAEHGARFRQKFTLEDAIGSHACSLEANMRMTNCIPLGRPLLLQVATVNCVQTLKARWSFCVRV